MTKTRTVPRPSTMADAFITAAIKAKKVDHSAPMSATWVTRRVVMNTERKGFGIVREYFTVAA